MLLMLRDQPIPRAISQSIREVPVGVPERRLLKLELPAQRRVSQLFRLERGHEGRAQELQNVFSPGQKRSKNVLDLQKLQVQCNK